jgi:hypothetical protein
MSIDLVENAIVTDSGAPLVFKAGKVLDAWMSRVSFEFA